MAEEANMVDALAVIFAIAIVAPVVWMIRQRDDPPEWTGRQKGSQDKSEQVAGMPGAATPGLILMVTMVDLGIMVVSVTMEMEVAMVVTEETAEAMEEVGIEGQETQFAEIRVSQNILSKDYRKLKRVSLPIVIHGPGADWRYFPFAFLLAYAGFVNLA